MRLVQVALFSQGQLQQTNSRKLQSTSAFIIDTFELFYVLLLA